VLLNPFIVFVIFPLEGFFPDKMKTAKVIPLFKAGNKQCFNNYRPVSVLSQFSKVLENLFVYKFDSFLEKHHLLSERQYGFRQKGPQ